MQTSLQHKRIIYLLCLPILILGIAFRARGEEAKPKSSDQGVKVTQTPPKQPKQKEKPSTQKNSEQEESLIKTIVDSIMRRFQEKKKSLISRGNVCAIAPGILEDENKIWSDRPLFAWVGQVDQIDVLSYETDELLWQTRVPSTVTSVQYAGQPLQPGKIYIWQISHNNKNVGKFLFELFSASERSQIYPSLDLLRTLEMNSEAAIDNNTVIKFLKNVDQFSEQGLWSDSLTLLNQVNLMSPDFFLTNPDQRGCQKQVSAQDF